MKKYASLLILALLLNGCDDGDLVVDTIDFSDPTITAQTCNTTTNGLIYKLKKQESLLIQFPDNTLANDATIEGKPLTYDINNTTFRVVYRAYNGPVTVANICGAIPPTTPGVTEEWQATAGKIVDIIVPETVNNADGSTAIKGYNHNLTFQNITFQKPSGPQVEAEYPFGVFKTTYNSPSTLFTGPLKQCEGNKTLVYNQTASTALTIENIDPLLLKNEVTTQPRVGQLSATTNKVLLRTFGVDGSLPPGYFCTTPLPSTPTVKETWNVGNSVENVNATIEVSTKLVGTTYFHTIVLKGVKFIKGNSNFKLPNEYTFGVLEIATTP